MAWHTGQGNREYRKDASAAKRPALNMTAIQDHLNEQAKPAKKRGVLKPYGLTMYWHSVISGRETWFTCWYATEADRDKGHAKHSADMLCGKPRYTRIVMVER
jgi:hypothetical protein